MMKLFLATGLAAATLIAIPVAAPAAAQPYGYGYGDFRYDRDARRFGREQRWRDRYYGGWNGPRRGRGYYGRPYGGGYGYGYGGGYGYGYPRGYGYGGGYRR